mmetsp:Transcript_13163/g.23543  ORF Transcript_13163/g.23543 Transcript_13163/m.23543 type:complete len:355 (+) Transcript_13163:77-1141(+)
MGWTATQQKILSIIPHFTALLSLFGSSYIIVTTLRDRKRWGTPFYRLLCALCLVDLFNSIASGLSTWPIPVGTPGVYAPLGTVGTCEAQGFFVQAGIASPIYNFMLSVQFLLRTKYGWNERRIGRRVEPIMHAITIGFALGTSFLFLSLDLYNESSLWCWVNASPSGCNKNCGNASKVTTCERGASAEIYRWTFYYGPLWLCVVGCMVMMVMIFLDIRAQENKMKKYEFSILACHGENRTSAIERKKAEDEKRRHAQSRAVAYQALRFVGAFYLTWLFPTVNRVLQASICHSYFWLMVMHTICSPMQGFCNFLVYIYPRNRDRIIQIATSFTNYFAWNSTKPDVDDPKTTAENT